MNVFIVNHSITDNKDQEGKVKSEPPVEIEYVEDTSLTKPEVEVPGKEDPKKEEEEEEKEILEEEVLEDEVPQKDTSEKEVPDDEVPQKEDEEDYLILNTEETPLDEEEEPEEDRSNSSILIGEAIVSVVTTKSVVNGTFSVPVTPLPQTTEQLDPPQSPTPLPEFSTSTTEANLQVTTEDSEKVLASVQTVRSISGARFLPFPGIDPLQYGHETTVKTVSNPATTDKSTESIIEKLDRVQSELSSGILATNFGSGNNIHDSNSSKTGQRSTTLKTPTISKFIPKRYSDRRLIKTTTSRPQSEDKTKVTESLTVSTTTARSTTTKKAKLGNLTVAVQDISAFLPPGKFFTKSEIRSESLFFL